MDSDYFRQRISMLRSLSGRASSHIFTSCLFEAKRPPGCVKGSSGEESDEFAQICEGYVMNGLYRMCTYFFA